MNGAAGTDEARGGVWHVPHVEVRLPDGSTLIRPQKAVLWMKIKDVSRLTGVEAKTLNRLADCGFIRRRRPSPNQSWFMPGEVFAFLARTEEDPDFWQKARRQAYLAGDTLGQARPLGQESGS